MPMKLMKQNKGWRPLGRLFASWIFGLITDRQRNCTYLYYLSLPNLQVSVGGQKVLQSTLQYGYEHFLEQVNLAEQLTSSDFGISTGLINQNYWENSKWYYVNVERGNAADKLNGRNINVSFTNNSNVPIEVMVFIFYSDEITIDVKTGLVTRHKN